MERRRNYSIHANMVLLPCCELPLAESHVGGRCDTDGVAEPMQIRLGCCSYDPTVALLNQNDVLRQGRISGESECVLVFAQGYTLCLHKCNSYLRMLCTEEQREQLVSAYACTSAGCTRIAYGCHWYSGTVVQVCGL